MLMDDLRKIAHTTAVSDEFLAEIGRIVLNYAILENAVKELIQELLQMEVETGIIITSEMSFRNLLNLASSLVCDICSEDEQIVFDEVLKLASSAEEERNQIVHSLWGFYTDKNTGEDIATRLKYTARRGKGLTEKMVPYKLQNLRDVAHRMSIASYEIEKFKDRIVSSFEE